MEDLDWFADQKVRTVYLVDHDSDKIRKLSVDVPYGVPTMELYFGEDPINFIERNEPVQVRIHEMIGPARFRSKNASKAISLAENVKDAIAKYQASGKQDNQVQ